MEILIKAKQANNPLFDFLNQSGSLNPFYKHTLQALKDGNYPIENEQTEHFQASTSNEATGSIYQNYYSSNQPMVSVNQRNTQKRSKNVNVILVNVT